MSNSLVSVIVPVYNAEKYLDRCIESILNQTYENIQLIIVNDGSTDSSKTIIDKYSADGRVIAVHKSNTGVSETRNTGINISSGEYIGFVDADDYIDSDMIEKMMSVLEECEADVCCCGYIQEFSDFRYEICIDERKVLNGVQEIYSQYLRQDLRNGIFDGNWNKLFKRSAISDIRYSNIGHCEDVDFQFRVFENCNRIVCIPDMLYHYISNNESATNSVFNEKKLSVLCVTDNVLEHVLSKYPQVAKEAYAFSLTWYLSIVQDIYSSGKSAEENKSSKAAGTATDSKAGSSDSVAKEAVKRIRKNLTENFSNYFGNPYSKRLDQYYLVSTVCGMTKPAIGFRNLVRSVVPSKDKQV